MVVWKNWRTYYSEQKVARRICSLLDDFKNDLLDKNNKEVWETNAIYELLADYGVIAIDAVVNFRLGTVIVPKALPSLLYK